ncbi:MAG: aspartate--tRNA ligase, partial [Rikenella sp.]|nr:aspartate--tRNA ligase [Rikenella sp.]
MYRTATCGELRLADVGKRVVLAGWVQKVRNLGAMVFVDLRDRYGITQVTVDEHASAELKSVAEGLGREYVIQVTGRVVERSAKNAKIPTGEIEVLAEEIQVLNVSEVPPFTIEEQSDGGDDLRMKYRYLDLRRGPLQRAMMLRHRLAQEVRRYLDEQGFMEIETPYLIKSTPEGARDFVVPSRMNPGEFYALPQSPQTFKQLLMVSGYDRYFQIVRCFRDEDLRADRQPEFTQVDCEMAFVEREDVLAVFEGMMRTMFDKTIGVKFASDRFPRMTWHEAMEKYGSDKPDIRFGMTFNDLTATVQGYGFAVFDGAEYVGGIRVPGCANYTRKQLDGLTEFVKRPQVGAKGLVYVRREADGAYKSSVDKFYTQEELEKWGAVSGMEPGDLLLILNGAKKQTLAALGALLIEMV